VFLSNFLLGGSRKDEDFLVSKDDISIRIASFLYLHFLPPSLSQIKEEKVFTKEEKTGASSRWGKKAQGINFELGGV
jgi:hypothetical protein